MGPHIVVLNGSRRFHSGAAVDLCKSHAADSFQFWNLFPWEEQPTIRDSRLEKQNAIEQKCQTIKWLGNSK